MLSSSRSPWLAVLLGLLMLSVLGLLVWLAALGLLHLATILLPAIQITITHV